MSADAGTEIERKYTPTSSDDDVGIVDLVIKVYKGGVNERFPDGGKMSQYMGDLKLGDPLEISGPWGMIEYVGRGSWLYGKRELQAKTVGMLAGGTGVRTRDARVSYMRSTGHADAANYCSRPQRQARHDATLADIRESDREGHSRT